MEVDNALKEKRKFRNILSEKYDKIKNKKIFYFIIILICYIPTYIAMFPLIYTYDVPQQVHNSISTANPLIHTILIKLFAEMGKSIGSITIGMTLFVLCQAVIMIAAFSETIDFIKRKTNNKVLEIISLLFFALFPFNKLFLCYATKDVLFAGFTLLAMIYLIDIIDGTKSKTKDCILGTIFLLLMISFRLNSVYALAVTIPFMIIALHKNKNLMTKIFIMFIVSILLYIGVNKLIISILHINDTNGVGASFQIHQAIGLITIEHEDELSENEKEKINYYYGGIENVKRNFNGYIADGMVKSLKQENYNKNPEEYNKFTKELIKRYPKTVLKSLLNTSRGYWYIMDDSFNKIGKSYDNHQFGCLTITFEIPMSKESSEEEKRETALKYKDEIKKNVRFPYVDGEVKKEEILNHYNLFPKLRNFYKWLFCENNYKKLPVLYVFFRPGIYTYITIAYLLLGIYRRQKEVIITGMYLLLYIGTCMLGPCSTIKYIYCIIVMSPIMVSYFFTKRKKGDIIQSEKEGEK